MMIISFALFCAINEVYGSKFLHDFTGGVRMYEQKHKVKIDKNSVLIILGKEHGYFYKKPKLSPDNLPDINIIEIGKYLDRKNARTSKNKTSTAFGYGQFLNSTWKNYGLKKTTDGSLQIYSMVLYIRQRYGTAHKAVQHHINKNWY